MANDEPDPADAPDHEAMMEDVDEGLSHQVAHASLVDNGNDDDGDDENEEDEDEEDDDDDDDEDDPMQDLPPAVVARVEQLQDLNAEREQIMMAYLEERAALELKYRRQCQPLYEKRAQIVKGSGIANTDNENEDEDGEGIPQFWVCAMGHEEDVAELLTEEDVDCLEYLTDITCVDFEDGKGFELQFHFSEQNPYFTNPMLTKTYHVPNLLLADEPILKNVLGCDIDWKEGKSLTYRTTKKKQRGKGKHSGQIRTVAKKERKDSFFHFFLPPKLPNMEDMDEDEADRLEEAFDADYDVAQAFRLHIVPKAVLWFTGQGDAEEMQLAMMTEEDLDAVVE
ncbi:hypothetical protein MHU86_1616 [Fragilaria crotonensis]|nr:hypothetical protein MHU86_1616 [Fragilaria crotonensis]